MKKYKSIIALVVILLLLGGAYFYVSKHPRTSTTSTSSTATTANTVKVWKVDSAKVSKIIVTYSGSVNTFVKSAKVWSIENYDYKLDQTGIGTVTDSLINLSGTVVEKNAKDLDKYGLNKSTVNVKIVGDGSDKIVLIGDKTSDGSNYYASEKDKSDVYFIASSIVDGFTAKQSVYRDKTITAIDASTLSSMKINQTGISPIEITRNSSQSDQEAQSSLNSWVVTGPYSVTIGGDDQAISTVAAAIANLKVSDIVEDNPKNLGLYGLDKPNLELTLKDSKNALHLVIGKDKDNSNVYFKTAESNTIYTIDKTVIDTFRVKPFALITKFAYIVDLDNVDKIVIDANGTKDRVDLARTSAKAAKSGDPDVVTTTSKINDKTIELSKFRTQYQEIIGLTVDAENDKKSEDKPSVSITYTLNKGSKKQQVVDFVPYNDEFYAVFKDGKSDFVIAREKVDKMITDLRALK